MAWGLGNSVHYDEPGGPRPVRKIAVETSGIAFFLCCSRFILRKTEYLMK
jgi:hypothetical protein